MSVGTIEESHAAASAGIADNALRCSTMPALAFVLVERAEPPDPAELTRRAKAFGYTLVHEAASSSPATYSIADGGILMVMVIDAPHPDVSKMAPSIVAPSSEDLQRARAHYIVVLMDGPTSPRDEDIMLARLTTAVVRSSPAVAAMLGHGICFHRAEFFAETVEAEEGLPLLVCVDITRAPEPDGRMSMLTHGLARHGREEFFVTASQRGKGALDFLISMSRWMLTDPSKMLPTGDTVGRSAAEKLVVQRVPDPRGEGPHVIRLDLDL